MADREERLPQPARRARCSPRHQPQARRIVQPRVQATGCGTPADRRRRRSDRRHRRQPPARHSRLNDDFINGLLRELETVPGQFGDCFSTMLATPDEFSGLTPPQAICAAEPRRGKVHRAAEALDCRTHHRVAKLTPPLRQKLGVPEPERPRLSSLGMDPPDSQKALPENLIISDNILVI